MYQFISFSFTPAFRRLVRRVIPTPKAHSWDRKEGYTRPQSIKLTPSAWKTGINPHLKSETIKKQKNKLFLQWPVILTISYIPIQYKKDNVNMKKFLSERYSNLTSWTPDPFGRNITLRNSVSFAVRLQAVVAVDPLLLPYPNIWLL